MAESAEGGLGAPVPSGAEATAPGAGRKLLLVDDDAPLRRSMARALERRGFQVLPAEGVAEARALAREHRPEFAVLDMRLAEGSGLDLVRTLRELRPETRIVIVTGYGNIATAVAAIKAGAVDYLAKPVARKPNVRRPGALGAHPAGVRAVQSQRLRDRPPPQHAPPHAAADPQQARAAGMNGAVQVRPARVSNMIRQARTGGGPAVGDRLMATACAVRTLPGET
jgi:ActR/RegA family two-component response regulator